MSEPSISSVVAWTEHDGPGRPRPGPPPRAYQALAVGFAGWFALALVGCEVIHHDAMDHVPLSPTEVLGGTAVLLGLPAMIVLLARRHVAGPWLAAALGGLATAVSLSQWALAPAYTAVEAGGFAVLAVAALLLGLAQLRARFAAPRPSLATPTVATPAAASSTYPGDLEPVTDRVAPPARTVTRLAIGTE